VVYKEKGNKKDIVSITGVVRPWRSRARVWGLEIVDENPQWDPEVETPQWVSLTIISNLCC